MRGCKKGLGTRGTRNISLYLSLNEDVKGEGQNI